MENAEGAPQTGTVPLRFCPNSNDLLYPKEDRQNKRLVYFCRNCDFTAAASDSCVHRRTISHSASEITAVLHDVRTDPTLPHSKDVQCALCDTKEAVFFSQTTTEGMSLFFQCISCGHKWKDTGSVA
ncbi:DNA-directed RNA polymerase, subunit C11/M/9 [Ostreococcus tauri]|uniref:DNA-directed RNA polymerase subunit n=1 Tax=Ostreococcus tauri TaxID=70448 RepID=A0A090N4N0_OSTTA|nr:DNA-directed RNA polymerase, subunit C11/M/9 [Ostreococcus tauri]CEG00995.1 DNA-directed RNA polymerase, subunit C11/M/9 [Ostreococcus tauri]|eukprot:XP_022840730.1 DNA-directed RNA polymerase, subunit C11/M/9 [Ostreococcus tauri]